MIEVPVFVYTIPFLLAIYSFIIMNSSSVTILFPTVGHSLPAAFLITSMLLNVQILAHSCSSEALHFWFLCVFVEVFMYFLGL